VTPEKKTPDTRDGWSKVDILLKVLVPVALLVVGQSFTCQQEHAALATQRIERLSTLIGPLSSENARERKLAIEVAGYLANLGELPLELVPTLLSIAKEDPSSAAAQAASVALDQVERTNPQLRPQIEATFAELRRDLLHVSTEAQREPRAGSRRARRRARRGLRRSRHREAPRPARG
jgi:hypothetical protein